MGNICHFSLWPKGRNSEVRRLLSVASATIFVLSSVLSAHFSKYIQFSCNWWAVLTCFFFFFLHRNVHQVDTERISGLMCTHMWIHLTGKEVKFGSIRSGSPRPSKCFSALLMKSSLSYGGPEVQITTTNDQTPPQSACFILQDKLGVLGVWICSVCVWIFSCVLAVVKKKKR